MERAQNENNGSFYVTFWSHEVLWFLRVHQQQELQPRRKTLSSNWDLDSCPDTSRGGAKEEGMVEGNSFLLAIKGLWARETEAEESHPCGYCA